MGWFFIFFFISGFCSILYAIVWLRLAMAQFGVTQRPGLHRAFDVHGRSRIGLLGSGYFIRKYGDRIRISPLRFYAEPELLIGISAIAVPGQLLWGRQLLERFPISSSWGYYLVSRA